MILAGAKTCEICQIEPAFYEIDFTTKTGYDSKLTCPACTDLFQSRRPYSLILPLPTEEHLLEQLADYAHASWSHWMRYLFSRSSTLPDGSVIIPADLVARWQRQMETPYQALPEQEKQSDRNQAQKIMPLLKSHQNSTKESEGKSCQ